MNRYLAPILVGFLLAGCKSQAPMTDPFFGRTTIPPPPTGSAACRSPDPYYATPPTVQMPSPTPPQPWCPPASSATTIPQPSPSWTVPQNAPNLTPPPWGSAPPGVAPSILAPRPSSTAPYRTSSSPLWGSLDDRIPRPIDDTGAEVSLMGRKPIVRTLQPRGASDDASNRPVDITDLPKAP